MESIDITDSVFSLDVSQVIGNNINGETNYDYTMYIYIGSAVLIILIGIFIYRYYKNKQNEEHNHCMLPPFFRNWIRANVDHGRQRVSNINLRWWKRNYSFFVHRDLSFWKCVHRRII